MNTIMLFSVNVSILLSIRSFTFLNVFVSFLYRRLFYQKWVTFLASTFAPNFDEGHKECMTGGMQLQNMRNARQDRGRTYGMYDRIGAGHEEFTTGGVQNMRNA